jgi:hypothetical protein
MQRKLEGYYQIYQQDTSKPGARAEIIREIWGLADAEWLIQKLNRGKTPDERHISFFRSARPSSKEKMADEK